MGRITPDPEAPPSPAGNVDPSPAMRGLLKCPPKTPGRGRVAEEVRTPIAHTSGTGVGGSHMGVLV